MYFARIALVAACVIVSLKGQEDENLDSREGRGQKGDNENESEEYVDSNLSDNHTFVALIDIVFTDNSKRTCTGAIIHENIVITAAHCFFGKNKLIKSKPELTASFVVIGTKRMFDTGYEQYLPIERYVVHPKYEGWTADLALVFTFAGMTSDKPGTIIPLASEKATAHMDSNVTVFSWGHARSKKVTKGSSLENHPSQKKIKKYKKLQEESSLESSCEERDKTADTEQKVIQKGNTAAMSMDRFRNEHYGQANAGSHHRPTKKKILRKFRNVKQKNVQDQSNGVQFATSLSSDEKQTTIASRYLTIAKNNEQIDSSINPYVFGGHDSYESIEKLLKTKHNIKKQITSNITTNDIKEPLQLLNHNEAMQGFNTELGSKKRDIGRPPRAVYSFKSDNNWRRSMGAQQNRLLIENFSFVNLQTCRAIVNKALPSEYNISNHNDVICYTNADRCVNEDDSGAPAVRRGLLVAITVGGAECEGDHVAVAMKIPCYCSWISDNLPLGSPALSCCKNCCDVTHKEVGKKRRHRLRN